MKRWLTYLIVALLASLPAMRLAAEDTDLFEQQIDTSTERPNILIVLDNTANWNTPFDWEKTALQTVFDGLDDRFNVGLMMFSETGGGNSNIDGGYVRYHIRQMVPTNRDQLKSIVYDLHILDDKSNGGKASLIMDEAYRYFSGRAADGGATKVKSDLGAFDGGSYRTGTATGNYSSPVSNGCAKNFIIYISNGPPADNSSDILRSETDLAAFGGNITPITVSPSGSQTVVADEWARFMHTDDLSNIVGDQLVTTYTVDVLPGSTGQGPGWTALLKSMASRGGGRYFVGNDASTLTTALQKIFDEIISTNSIFAAVTLPVSVAVRGEYLNQIYMGVFRPDPNRSPRWPGNVKLYQLGLYDTGSGFAAQLQDAAGNPVEDSTSGFVTGCARSFWTTNTTFWGYSPNINCASDDPEGDSDLPDGNAVEKGGAGQMLRSTYASSQTARNMYTCSGASCTSGASLSADPFNTSNTTLNTAMTDIYGAVANIPVTLARTTGSGLVTATAASDVNLGSGDPITLSGASDALYNMTTVVTGSSPPRIFEFTVTPTESPEASTCTTGCTATLASGGTFTATGLTRSGLMITVTTSAAHGLTAGNSVTISGVTLPTPFSAGANNANPFNGTFTILGAPNAPTATTFKFNLPAPAYSATQSGAVAKVGATISPAIEDIRVDDYLVTLSAGANFNNAFGVTTNNVAVTGVLPNPLKCNNDATACFKIAAAASCNTAIGSNANRRFCYETIPTAISTSFTVSSGSTKDIAGIVRTAGTGAQTATVTTTTDHGFVTGNTILIGGANAANNAYNGNKTITVPLGSTNTFTYGVTVTETPSTSATALVTKGGTTVVASELINWMRGADNFEDENQAGSASPVSASTDIRASAHGDVVHSRPVVIDYYTGGASDVVAFYGANDGAIHAIQGGSGSGAGTELWSFVAREHYNRFARLRNQSPTISTATPKPYFFDGPIGNYVKRNDDGTINKAYIYATMRRGGRFIYAFDVTSKTNPKFLWKAGCPNTSGTTGCTSGFGELGQTWSTPIAARLKIGTTETIALIMGAGYDNNVEDADDRTPATRSMGRGVFIINVADGSILKSFTTGVAGSVAGDVFLADSDANGWDDIAYFADTNGEVWRIDIGGTATTDWTMNKIASLGNDQKFLFSPTVASCSDDTGDFYAVLIGAGDREHPKEDADTCSANNYFYMVKDRNTTTTPTTPTVATASSLTTVTPGTAIPNDDAGMGWKLRLNADSCEKTVSGAAVADGTVFFNTHAPTDPSAGQCSSLGTARAYGLGACNAARPTYPEGAVMPSTAGCGGLCFTLAGGGLAPTPVAARVRLDNPNPSSPPDEQLDCGVIIIGTSGIPLDCGKAGPRYRTYWYEVGDK